MDFIFLGMRRRPRSTLFPYTSLFRSRLMGARHSVRRFDIAMEISAAETAVWQVDDPNGGVVGRRYLARQGSELGGGSTEIQRNIISERILDMPREPAADRGVPFNQVRRNAMPTKSHG